MHAVKFSPPHHHHHHHLPPPPLNASLDRTVEVFDPRLERWRVEERFGAGDEGRALTDACLLFQP